MQPALKQLLITTIVCLVFIVGVKVYLQKYQDQHLPAAEKIALTAEPDCVLVTGCEFTASGFVVALQAKNPVRVLEPFQLIVKPSGAINIETMNVNFTMQGMNMGINSFHFTRSVGNVWQTEVILPLCTQRRTDWIMDVTINTDKNKQYFLSQSVVVNAR